MKKITTLIVMLLIAYTSQSQIKKLNTVKDELVGKVQHMKLNKSSDTYTIVYKDHNYYHLDEFKSFSFEDVDNAFEDLYSMIMQGFKEMPKERIMLELPNDIIWLDYSKTMGIVSLKISHAVNKNSEVIGLTRFLTKKQVIKLFGKKKKK